MSSKPASSLPDALVLRFTITMQSLNRKRVHGTGCAEPDDDEVEVDEYVP